MSRFLGGDRPGQFARLAVGDLGRDDPALGVIAIRRDIDRVVPNDSLIVVAFALGSFSGPLDRAECEFGFGLFARLGGDGIFNLVDPYDFFAIGATAIGYDEAIRSPQCATEWADVVLRSLAVDVGREAFDFQVNLLRFARLKH